MKIKDTRVGQANIIETVIEPLLDKEINGEEYYEIENAIINILE